MDHVVGHEDPIVQEDLVAAFAAVGVADDPEFQLSKEIISNK